MFKSTLRLRVASIMRSISYLLPVLMLVAQCPETFAFQVEINVDIPEDAAILIVNKKYGEAEKLLSDAGKLNPTTLSWLLFLQGRNDEGIQILEERIGDDPPTSKLLLENLTLASEGSLEVSESVYESYLSRFPDKCEDSLLTLFVVRLKARLLKLDEAIILLQPVIDSGYTGEKLKETILDIAIALDTNDRASEGLEYLDKLFTLVPETSLDPGYNLQWVHLANNAGKSTQALMVLDKIETNFPDYAIENRAFISLAKGNAYEAIGKREESLKIFDELKDMPSAKSFGNLPAMKVQQFNEEIAFETRMREEALAVNAPLLEQAAKLQEPNKSNKWIIVIFANCIFAAIIFILVSRKRRLSTPE